jgi:hypothetical protein
METSTPGPNTAGQARYAQLRRDAGPPMRRDFSQLLYIIY